MSLELLPVFVSLLFEFVELVWLDNFVLRGLPRVLKRRFIDHLGEILTFFEFDLLLILGKFFGFGADLLLFSLFIDFHYFICLEIMRKRLQMLLCFGL